MNEVILEKNVHKHAITHNAILTTVCPCGKSIANCDCITCAKCGVLFKPYNNQIICKKCLLAMEVS